MIIIGEAGVGKTNFLNRILIKDFNPYTKSTVGLEFSSKLVNIQDAKIITEIWDTAGTERYHSLSKSFYRQSAGAFLIFDVTDRASFISLNKWLREFKFMASSDAYIIIIGNKCDSNERQVSFEEGNKFALMNNSPYYETSSITNENIEEAFQNMIQVIYSTHKDDLIANQSLNISLRTTRTSSDTSKYSITKLSKKKLKEKPKTKCSC